MKSQTNSKKVLHKDRTATPNPQPLPWGLANLILEGIPALGNTLSN